MTAAEVSYARRIFGDETDYSRIRLHMDPARPDGMDSITYVDHNIALFGQANWSSDFAQDTPQRRGTMMHELTHEHQYQTRTCFDASNRVDFNDLGPDSRWDQFEDERQARLIENYVLVFHENQRSLASIPESQHDDLRRVVEDRFPNARESRLQLEGQRMKNEPHLLTASSSVQFSGPMH